LSRRLADQPGFADNVRGARTEVAKLGRSGAVEKPSRAEYSPCDFQQWREGQALEITPKFQRRNVWKLPQRSYLIDTILRQMPVPPIYLRNIYDPIKKKVVREVVDGQQRLRSVLDYIEDKYAIAKTLDAPYAGKRYSALSVEQQTTILSYRFICDTFDGISDREVLEVFQRLNTYSVPLSSQELRNGRFFGKFKQCCYSVAYDHLEFWRANRIFTEDKIARMLEVQMTSELLIAEIAGMQDKKKSIDDYYDQYDSTFPEQEMYAKRFRIAIDQITESIGEQLRDSAFRRPPFFYSLFCVVYHRTFGLPGIEDIESPKKRLSSDEGEWLKTAIDKLSGIIVKGRQHESVPRKYSQFLAACQSQTDNIQPRTIRFKTLYQETFGSDA
jgi:hypothetical protein